MRYWVGYVHKMFLSSIFSCPASLPLDQVDGRARVFSFAEQVKASTICIDREIVLAACKHMLFLLRMYQLYLRRAD